MKTQYAKQHSYAATYRREIGMIVCAATLLFLILALVSYNQYDNSWFYFSSENNHITNWCGPVGAHVAALLVFLFGIASYLLLAFSVFILYLLIRRRSWAYEWDRIAAFLVLMFLVSVVGALHGSAATGGLVGHTLYGFLFRWFDTLGSVVAVYTLLLIVFIIVVRFSWVKLIHMGIHGARLMGGAQGFVAFMYNGVRKVISLAARPVVYSTNYCRSLIDGSIVEEDGTSSLLLFEYAAQESEHSEEDPFWLELSKPGKQEIRRTAFLSPSKDEGDLVRSLVEENTAKLDLIKPADNSVDAPIESANSANLKIIPHADSLITSVEPKSITDVIDTVVSPVPYSLPNLSIFIGIKDKKDDANLMKDLEVRAKTLEEKLERFGVAGKVVAIKCGPVVTLFEYKPEIDSKISKIVALEDDLALALQALSIRIIAPIPGRSVVGFEVANTGRKDVLFADVIRSDAYTKFKGALPLVLGKDTIGNNVVVDLAKMPHLLIAGSTGSGKSVGLNGMLVTLLCACSPEDLKLILIDPKRLEFAVYADIAHLLFPIVTNPKQASPVLKWVVQEMEARYELMAEYGARSLSDFNDMVEGDQKKPRIVVVIDELADLMMTTGKDVEGLIARIAQMARAAGIHLIVATQRPSVDVITGLIKVNFPSRISFRVTSKIDSRTILDCSGADKLLGRGDMLFLDATDANLKRIHGAYVTDKEIAQLTDYIRAQQPVAYLDIMQELPPQEVGMREEDDGLYQEVLEYIKEIDEVSISLLQRKFRIGYNRSARIIDSLEAKGLIMPSEGGKTRKVIRH